VNEKKEAKDISKKPRRPTPAQQPKPEPTLAKPTKEKREQTQNTQQENSKKQKTQENATHAHPSSPSSQPTRSSGVSTPLPTINTTPATPVAPTTSTPLSTPTPSPTTPVTATPSVAATPRNDKHEVGEEVKTTNSKKRVLRETETLDPAAMLKRRRVPAFSEKVSCPSCTSSFPLLHILLPSYSSLFSSPSLLL
jgi:hypothetical protein